MNVRNRTMYGIVHVLHSTDIISMLNKNLLNSIRECKIFYSILFNCDDCLVQRDVDFSSHQLSTFLVSFLVIKRRIEKFLISFN